MCRDDMRGNDILSIKVDELNYLRLHLCDSETILNRQTPLDHWPIISDMASAT